MKLPKGYESIFVIDDIDVVEDAKDMRVEEERLREVLAAILVNYDADNDMEGYMETVNSLEGLGYYS